MWIVSTLIASILFAASSMVNKLAMKDNLPTDRLLPATFLAGFLLLVIYNGRSQPHPHGALVMSGLAMSLFSMLNCVAILLALGQGPVGPVAAVAGTHSIITPVLAWIIFQQRLNVWQWSAVLLATGAMILVQDTKFGRENKSIGVWFVLALLGAAGSSGETLVLDHAVTLKDDGTSGLVWSYFFSFVFTSLWFMRHRQQHVGKPFFLGALDGAISATGMIFFSRALHGGPAGLVAALSTSAVVLRALGGRLCFGDRLPAQGWAGVALAFAAFALVSFFGTSS